MKQHCHYYRGVKSSHWRMNAQARTLIHRGSNPVVFDVTQLREYMGSFGRIVTNSRIAPNQDRARLRGIFYILFSGINSANRITICTFPASSFIINDSSNIIRCRP